MPPTYTYLGITGQYILCSLIMLALYCKIFSVARQQKRKISDSMVGAWSSAAKSTKTTKTLAMVLGVFLVCWTPFFCLASVQAAGTHSDVVDTVYFVGLMMGLTNSCLNPVIYGWRSMEFRQAYVTLVRGICSRRQKAKWVVRLLLNRSLKLLDVKVSTSCRIGSFGAKIIGGTPFISVHTANSISVMSRETNQWSAPSNEDDLFDLYKSIMESNIFKNSFYSFAFLSSKVSVFFPPFHHVIQQASNAHRNSDGNRAMSSQILVNVSQINACSTICH